VPIFIYSLVAGIDLTKALKAGIIPGLFMIGLFVMHAMYIGVKYEIPRTRPNLREMTSSLWGLKWELAVPVLVLGSLAVGLASIDEAAAIAAVFVACVELLIFKDLKPKDMPRLAGVSFALAGALVLIMAMAVSLTNYLITQDVPTHFFDWVTHLGVTERWHFLVARNFLMYAIGAVMEGFSAIFVAVPLLLPFGARFVFSPFHLAVMFLLDLEIAFLSPPFGQNLFVTSFRFGKPMTSLYRIALPFLGIMFFGLTIIMLVPWMSTVSIQGDIVRARADAASRGEPPRDAWMIECVQLDRNNPLPCTEEDERRWGKVVGMSATEHPAPTPSGSSPADEHPVDETDFAAGSKEEEAFMNELLGDEASGDPASAASASP